MHYGSITLNGVKYLVSACTQNHISCYIREATRCARKAWDPLANLRGLSEQERLFAIRQAISADMPGDLVNAALESPEAIAYLLWLLIKPNHPDMSYELCRALVTDENVDDVHRELSEQSGIGEME